jgi:hypothetical protein
MELAVNENRDFDQFSDSNRGQHISIEILGLEVAQLTNKR